MENIIEIKIKNICKKISCEYKSQITVKEIKNIWGIIVPTDKSERKYDFVINNKGKLLFIEVNYYNGKGSKLKSVANEFTKLDNYMKKNNFEFCWITDGLGWKDTKKPLKDAFKNIQFIYG